MTRRRHTSSIILSAATFIVLEIAAISLLKSTSSLQNTWMMRATQDINAWLWGRTSNRKTLKELQILNEEISYENLQLRSRVLMLEDLLERKGFESGSAIPDNLFRYVPAKVVYASESPTRSYIVLDKGSEDGIAAGSGIVSSRGVVGIIEAVAEHKSYGFTILNHDIGVSARIGRAGLASPLSWSGMSRTDMRMSGLPLGVKAAPGDTIYTSGLSALFPSGIPIGIVREKSVSNGATADLSVEMLQDISEVRFVYVAINDGVSEINGLIMHQEERQ